MAIADHVIFTAYGFWLPNDPRGSCSDFVRSWELFRFGPATKVHTRRSVAHVAHDSALRAAAKEALLYPPVTFTDEQIAAVAAGFASAVAESRYRVVACSILAEHVHMVILRGMRRPRQIVGHLKARATQMLTERKVHPLHDCRDTIGQVPSPWARKSWDVFLDTTDDLWRAIRYVRENPLREGKDEQVWPFVETLAGA